MERSSGGWRASFSVPRSPAGPVVSCCTAASAGWPGVAGFWLILVLLIVGFTVSASVIGTVVGLLLITVALRVSRRLGSLHRRLLRRFLGHQVEAPPRFQPGTGVLGRLDRRLRDRAAWRGVWYSLIKLPVAAVQLYTVVLTAFGLIDISYPVDWLLFRNDSAGGVCHRWWPWCRSRSADKFRFPAGWAPTRRPSPGRPAWWRRRGWAARSTRRIGALVRGLLGPSSMAERVSELERTRTLAVEDSAAALRRVERDLHDGAQMRLAALAMNLGMAREKLDDDHDAMTVRELIDAAHRNAVDALADLRDLARGIHPPVLDNGLASALDTLAASSAIPASVTADIDPRPAPAIETIAYFCAAELMANATKHSYANQIKIKIRTERDRAATPRSQRRRHRRRGHSPGERPRRTGAARVHRGRADRRGQPGGRPHHGDRRAAPDGLRGHG